MENVGVMNRQVGVNETKSVGARPMNEAMSFKIKTSFVFFVFFVFLDDVD